MIGLLSCLFAFSGYEGAAHMSEETTNATLSAPKGIIWTCIATAITGFVYLLGLLYAANE
jgi:amino acid transporter